MPDMSAAKRRRRPEPLDLRGDALLEILGPSWSEMTVDERVAYGPHAPPPEPGRTAA